MLPQKGSSLGEPRVQGPVLKPQNHPAVEEAGAFCPVLPGPPGRPRARAAGRAGGSGSQGRRQVAWGHFHAVLEPFQLARPTAASRRAIPAAARRNGTSRAGQRFARRLQHVGQRDGPSRPNSPDRVRRSAVSTAPHPSAVTEVVRQRAHVETGGDLHLAAAPCRRRTTRISSRFTVTATASGPRASAVLASAREVVRSLAVDVLRGKRRRRLIERAAEPRDRRVELRRASDVDRVVVTIVPGRVVGVGRASERDRRFVGLVAGGQELREPRRAADARAAARRSPSDRACRCGRCARRPARGAPASRRRATSAPRSCRRRGRRREGIGLFAADHRIGPRVSEAWRRSSHRTVEPQLGDRLFDVGERAMGFGLGRRDARSGHQCRVSCLTELTSTIR